MLSSKNTKKKEHQLEKAQLYHQQAMLMFEGEYVNSRFTPLTLLQKASDLHYPPAMTDLGIHLLLSGRHMAGYHYLLAARKRNYDFPLATFYLGYCCLKGIAAETNFDKAEEYLQETIDKIKLKQKNHCSTPKLDQALIDSLVFIAEMNLREFVAAPNLNKAIKLLSEAESRNSLIAKHMLATVLLQQSEACTDEKKKACLKQLWLKKINDLVAENYLEAIYDLGLFKLMQAEAAEADTVTADQVMQAINLLWRAIIGGKNEAFIHIADVYLKQNNFHMYSTLLATGAHLGNLRCRFLYGYNVYYAPDVSKEEKNGALSYILDAAEGGDKDAMYEFAKICLSDFGLEKNDKIRAQLLNQTMYYFGEASNCDHYSAKWELAKLLIEFNDDVLESLIQAKQVLDQIITECSDSELIESSLPLLNKVKEKIDTLPARINLKTRKKTISKERKPLFFHSNHKRTNWVNPLLTEKIEKEISEEKKTESKVEASFFTPFNFSPTLQAESATEIKLSIPGTESVSMPEEIFSVVEKINDNPNVSIHVPDDVKANLEKLTQCGFKAYLVGGLIRNLISRKTSPQDDVDIVTDAPVEKVEKIFGISHNLQLANLCQFNSNTKSYDVISVPALDQSGLIADAMKRDFTINALYAGQDGKVLDPTGRGLADLADPVIQIRSILPDQESFLMDPFRMLRYIYFSALGFSGDLNQQDMMTQLKKFREKFNPAVVLPEAQDDIIQQAEERAQLLQRFHSMICKFFMSGKAKKVFDELLKYQFFDIFFAADQFDKLTLKWLRWQFEAVDVVITQSNPAYGVKAWHIYGILAAALVRGDFANQLTTVLESQPFPTYLRWRINFSEEVLSWIRVKSALLTVPVELYSNLLFANFFNKQTMLPSLENMNCELTPCKESRQFGLTYSHHGYFRQPPPKIPSTTVSAATLTP